MRLMLRFSWMMAPLIAMAVAGACAGGAVGGSTPAAMTTMDTITLGRQLVLSHACGDCHGGGDNPAAPGYLDGMRDTIFQQFRFQGFVSRPRNITPDPTTGIGRFTERQIFNALRFGLRPGETPDVEITGTTPGQGNFPATPHYLAPPMPWPSWRHMKDVELWAIAAYLKRAVKPSVHKVEDSTGPPDFWADLYRQFIGPPTLAPFPTANEVAPGTQ